MNTVINKWRKHGTTVTLPRTGCPSKTGEKKRRKLVSHAAKGPTLELQEFLASTGCSLHVTSSPMFFVCLGYGVGQQELKPFLWKKKKTLKSAKFSIQSPKTMWEKCAQGDKG